ncbi:unnamed protein product [Rotaria sordida]|uniref:Microbial-type PARG catalytic domain-containing protein n=1 Tax=Rotaria sordida TaxID=392033 RepID=A0A814Q5T4_9BILA|nr:unnamed protein product [Rotaria sordida]CAF1114559.1 unnamed protein product [Rotaria sordida]
MANATSPGGGYRKGDGAQEENIFRRSDYYQSLDGELADTDRSERIFCTSKCELKPFAGYGGLYPIPEFGAIYTSGITVFRQTETNGHHIGEATLSHAGSNGIYNHEKISYQFNKRDLDLSRIDYIHVSAGSQNVPIRRLRISHESAPELHPSFDKDFRIDTSNLMKMHRSSVPYTAPLPPTTPRTSTSRPSRERSRVATDVGPQERRSRAASAGATAKPRKPSIFRRVINAIFSSLTDDEPPKSNPARSSSVSAAASSNSGEMSSPKLPPCSESVYCLRQQIRDHTKKYSHPCRFNELCRNKAHESHLVHENHKVSKCPNDVNCSERTNPVHRAKYRHTDLPDYLIPCRYQEECYDRSKQHRMKFFHGEELPKIEKSKTLVNPHAGGHEYGGTQQRLSQLLDEE